MNNAARFPMEPGSKRKLSEIELCEIVKGIAIRIEEPIDRYPLFKSYYLNEVMIGSNLIW